MCRDFGTLISPGAGIDQDVGYFVVGSIYTFLPRPKADSMLLQLDHVAWMSDAEVYNRTCAPSAGVRPYGLHWTSALVEKSDFEPPP